VEISERGSLLALGSSAILALSVPDDLPASVRCSGLSVAAHILRARELKCQAHGIIKACLANETASLERLHVSLTTTLRSTIATMHYATPDGTRAYCAALSGPKT
jgi:hypothetical protein